MKRYTPTYHANNLFEVDPLFFIKINAKVLLLDLDNTLDSYKTKLPSERTINYIKQLKALNLRPIITSNNRSKRVKNYARALEIECLSSVAKPFKHFLLKKLNKLNIDLKECILIGDQLMTDIACGNALKIKTLLLEKLVKEDQFTTHFNRIFDKPLRARLKKCGKLNNWKEVL
ncbi:MAG: HAD hydrolase-like protein [Bacilli bacterium]|nr:HAD hydrolase-like protein [Bacilli bacterium]